MNIGTKELQVEVDETVEADVLGAFPLLPTDSNKTGYIIDPQDNREGRRRWPRAEDKVTGDDFDVGHRIQITCKDVPMMDPGPRYLSEDDPARTFYVVNLGASG